MILYDTENQEEVTLFFKNTNIRECDEFKVTMYPLDTETKIRFFFANSWNVYQTEWIKARPRTKKRTEHEGRNKANSDDRNSTPSQDSSPLADLETTENSDPKLVKIFLKPNHGQAYYPPKGLYRPVTSCHDFVSHCNSSGVSAC